MHSQLLPFSLLLLLGQFTLPVWSSASLVPPTVLPSSASSGASSSSSRASSSASRNSSSTITITGTSASASTSSSAPLTSSTQYPSLSGVSSCVSNCLATAISRVGCDSVVEVNCFCVNTLFSPELVACIEAACPDQLSTSENLAQQFCNLASMSPSLSFVSIPTTSSSASVSVSTSSATIPPTTAASTTPSIASSRNTFAVGHGTLFGLFISALGVILGAYAVL